MIVPAIGCHRIGRYNPKEKQCSLWWSGSGVRLRIACRSLSITAESFAADHAPWLGVMIDGAPAARFPMADGKARYQVLAGMEPGVWHEVTILRDTQPTTDETGPVLLYDLETDGSIEAPAPRERLIEFIGDSLTVGEGCVGPKEGSEWRMVWISHMPAFPTLAAEMLHADKRVVGVGGWGVWKSWDCNENCRLGLLYDQLCGLTPGGDVPYDFSARHADAVVINLGTNDCSALQKEGNSQEAREQITRRAVELMQMIRVHEPEALILWAYGLCGTEAAPLLREAVRQTGDQRVFYLPLTDCAGDVGSRQHPSRAAHRRAAAEIARFLQDKL